ncbi:MAG TPA: SIMPL domain-containing protein [Roseiflexaceae bacterium]|nr:SIMPL domain-containing protein [Roseiflexaceae bacterium]
MQRRLITITAVVAVLVALAAAAVAFPAALPAQAQQNPTTTINRQITVVGHGEVKVQPDTAIIQIGVETEAKTAREALNQNNADTAAVQKKLTDLKVDTKDMQTSGFGIYPVYGTDGRQVTGYRVNNTVTVKIRKLDQAPTLLDQVVQAGANSIYGISFTVDNPRTLQDQARTAAMQDAKARADLLAKAGGASVGQVLVITENVGTPMPIAQPMAIGRAAGDQAGSAVPLQTGEQTVSIDVQVTYELK